MQAFRHYWGLILRVIPKYENIARCARSPNKSPARPRRRLQSTKLSSRSNSFTSELHPVIDFNSCCKRRSRCGQIKSRTFRSTRLANARTRFTPGAAICFGRPITRRNVDREWRSARRTNKQTWRGANIRVRCPRRAHAALSSWPVQSVSAQVARCINQSTVRSNEGVRVSITSV